MSALNPYQRDGLWYWFDETFDENGPYGSEAEAECYLAEYVEWLAYGEEEDE